MPVAEQRALFAEYARKFNAQTLEQKYRVVTSSQEQPLKSVNDVFAGEAGQLRLAQLKDHISTAEGKSQFYR